MKYLSVIMLAILSGCGYVGDAYNTTFQETKASTLLKKYEWFKNAAAQLDKKAADIKLYEIRIQTLEERFKDKELKRYETEQLTLWQTEMIGVKASYNSLAAEYNSNMAKINWAFTNAGQVPAGGEPLPREFRTYQ